MIPDDLIMASQEPENPSQETENLSQDDSINSQLNIAYFFWVGIAVYAGILYTLACVALIFGILRKEQSTKNSDLPCKENGT